MPNMIRIASTSLLAAVLAACGNTGPASAEKARAPTASQPGAPTGVPVPLVEATLQNLPGVYTGALPCGDCAAVVTRLELLSDGSYKVNEVFDGKDAAALDSNGKWRFDAVTRHVTLDPAAQDWQDREFEALQTKALRALDGNGVPYSSEGANDLKAVR